MTEKCAGSFHSGASGTVASAPEWLGIEPPAPLTSR